MESSETDIVLSAIRRGEDSLPKLRAATGLEYAKLHEVVYKLEFEWRSIKRTETADGFDRFTPTASEKSNGGYKGVDWKDEQPKPVSPWAFAQTRASLEAREAALAQRDAPYCVGCQKMCVHHGVDRNGRIRWRCKPCDVTFAGSGIPGDLNANRLPTEKREKAIDLFSAGKSIRAVAREAEIAPMTAAKIKKEVVTETAHMAHIDPEESPQPEKEPEEICVDCGKPRSIGSGQRCRPCYLAKAEAKRQEVPADNKQPDNCGCGRPKNHGGRCSYRRATSPSLADELAAEQRTKAMGRPRIDIDLKRLEDAIANPTLSMGEVADQVGIKRNLIYDRKDVDPEFRAAYDRGMERREQALRSQISEDFITKPITSNGDGAELPDSAPSKREPKSAMAKVDEIIPRNIPATVDGQGVVLYDSIDDCVSEVVNWPKERVVEFFESLAKAIGLPQRPVRTEIKLAWSKDFESCDPEGTTGLTYLYLVSMLHHRMEPHEKDAVWTLIQYLKRLECAVEERKAGA